MSELKIYLPDNLNNRFRRIAMSVYGYGRGSLSRAAEDALSKWCEQHESDSTSSSTTSPESKINDPEPKTIRIDPEERPATVAEPDASNDTRLKSAS